MIKFVSFESIKERTKIEFLKLLRFLHDEELVLVDTVSGNIKLSEKRKYSDCVIWSLVLLIQYNLRALFVSTKPVSLWFDLIEIPQLLVFYQRSGSFHLPSFLL